MNKKYITYTIFLLIVSLNCFASGKTQSLDTVLMRTMYAAEKYNDLVESYSAEVYTRSYVNTLRKNFLYKFTHLIPEFVLHDPNNDEVLIETISEFRYDYPKNYVQDIKHVIGTVTGRKDIETIPFELLNLNIYGETTNEESFFMPIRFSTAKYYRYELSNSFTENNKSYYTINFDPIYENPKLLKGSFIIERGTWRVVFFRGEGVDIFSEFSVEMTMGNEWITNYLPVNFVIFQTTSYLGNVLSSRHLAHIEYNDIELRKVTEPELTLNISDFYKVRLDSVPLYTDSVFWNKKRPIPLQERERDVMDEFRKNQKDIEIRTSNGDSITETKIAQQLAQRMVMNSNYKYRSMKMGYSGLLNPLMLGYSSRDGLTYRQKLSFNIDAAGFVAEKLEAKSVVSLENGSVTSSKITLAATIKDISREKFDELVSDAEKNCPISKLLNAEISVDATLNA